MVNVRVLFRALFRVLCRALFWALFRVLFRARVLFAVFLATHELKKNHGQWSATIFFCVSH